MNHYLKIIADFFNLKKKKTVIILTKKNALFMAKMYQQAAEEFGFKAKIISGRKKRFSKDLHIVLFPHIFPVVPENWIAVQLEQATSPWMTDQYINKLLTAKMIFEYSKINEDQFVARGIPREKISLIPMSTANLKTYTREKKYEVLFYGSLDNPRRKKWVDEISSRFKTKIVTSAYNNELYQLIAQSKIVVNIHFYEEATLETTRILECLCLGALIVSEDGVDQADHRDLENIVHFTPIGNLNKMIETIEKLLREGTPANDQGIQLYLNEKRTAAQRIFNKSLERVAQIN